MREKIEFITDNKDAIIDNLGVVGYDLFTILSDDNSLVELDEYKKVQKFLNSRKINTGYNMKDELYILHYLSSILDKISMDLKEKESYRAKIFKYIEYINRKKANKSYVKIIRRTA